jgi:hypothetical protein
MLQHVMPDFMGMKQVMVLNDAAHHYYREKPEKEEKDEVKGDDEIIPCKSGSSQLAMKLTFKKSTTPNGTSSTLRVPGPEISSSSRALLQLLSF